MLLHLMEQFNLSRYKSLTLDVSDPTTGNIRVNSQVCASYPWTGKYFPNIPVTVTALPKPGYKFLRWSDGDSSISRKIDVDEFLSLTAVFVESYFDPLSIVINEISYISSPSMDTEDWVELYNTSDVTVDLSDWNFKDGGNDNVYVFPESIFIQPNGYLVLSRDTISFKSFHTIYSPLFGNMDFGFSSGGELLTLYSDTYEIIDYVKYDVFSPWPDLVTNSEYSIELTNPQSDNLLGENWELSSSLGGTPGAPNSSLMNANELSLTVENIAVISIYPNPFRTSVNIEYFVSETGPVSIHFLNITGQIIRTVHNRELTPGQYSCI